MLYLPFAFSKREILLLLYSIHENLIFAVSSWAIALNNAVYFN